MRSASSSVMRSHRFRPKRSSFQTMRVSPGRRALRQRVRAGRLTVAPERPSSVKIVVHPARCKAARCRAVFWSSVAPVHSRISWHHYATDLCDTQALDFPHWKICRITYPLCDKRDVLNHPVQRFQDRTGCTCCQLVGFLEVEGEKPFIWLRVFRSAGASRSGHRRRQQQHTRVVWSEKNAEDSRAQPGTKCR